MKRRNAPRMVTLLLASALLVAGCAEVALLHPWVPKRDTTSPPAPPPIQRPANGFEAKFGLAGNEYFLSMPPLQLPAAASPSQPVRMHFVYQPECRVQRFEVQVDEAAKQVYVAYITSDKVMICGGIVSPPAWIERSFTPRATGTYRVTTVVSSHSYSIEVQ